MFAVAALRRLCRRYKSCCVNRISRWWWLQWRRHGLKVAHTHCGFKSGGRLNDDDDGLGQLRRRQRLRCQRCRGWRGRQRPRHTPRRCCEDRRSAVGVVCVMVVAVVALRAKTAAAAVVAVVHTAVDRGEDARSDGVQMCGESPVRAARRGGAWRRFPVRRWSLRLGSEGMRR